MKNYNEMFLAILAGAVSGAFVLGFVGRIVTAGVGLITSNPLNLSLAGLLEVVVVGLIVGTIGGVFFFIIKNVFCEGNKLTMGIIVGLIMNVCFAIFMIIKGGITMEKSLIFLFALSIVIFLIYGILLSKFFTWLNQHWREC